MATPLSVVPRVEPFLAAFAEGSLLFARAHGTKPERVARLAAICLRESLAGTAPGYRPRGSPDGTGDWVARTGHWLKRMGVRVVAELPAGWSAPKMAGQVVTGPYAIPLDGLGWGRGLLQADALGDFRDLIAPAPWPVETQAAAACAMLDKARRELAEFRHHALFERAVCARYNAALPRIVTGMENAITKNKPDAVDEGTTGGDYGRDVLALEAAVVARWPDTGVDLPARTGT